MLGDTGSQVANATALWTYGQLAWDRGDVLQAAALHGAALEGFREMGKPWGGIDCIEGLAFLAGQQGDPRRAARLLGAADSWRETVGMLRPPVAQPVYDQVVSMFRTVIGDDTFTGIWEEGKVLTPAQATAMALETASQLSAEPAEAPRSAAALLAEEYGLTRREVDVLRLLIDGHSDREIAETLSISERTVGGHVTHLLGKLDVRSRGAAATFALRHNLV